MPTHTYPPDSSDPQDPEAHYNKSGTFPQAKFIWYAEWFLGMKLELELAAAGGDTNAEAVLHAARYFQNAIDQYNEPDREGEEPDYGN